MMMLIISFCSQTPAQNVTLETYNDYVSAYQLPPGCATNTYIAFTNTNGRQLTVDERVFDYRMSCEYVRRWMIYAYC